MVGIDEGRLQQRIDRLRGDIIDDLPGRLAVIDREVTALQQLAAANQHSAALKAAETIAYLSHKLTGSLSIVGWEAAIAAGGELACRCRTLVNRPDSLCDSLQISRVTDQFATLRLAIEALAGAAGQASGPDPGLPTGDSE
ncbi:hypothetical protein FKG94_26795 [Exilibacterium tricleocarpae]|uniref:Hpt domain-containing protein n=1 Tax=Exilibacterium tricleocarpae TaxID=2591008 RepID=A0A545SPB6_9GAMM|nr:hypothetical protein [Exilibacterium tricleocarpae]TQV66706.1 hypothetical protein FKG94_26795 [Exilibacterium tricleocarpae]